MTLIEDLRFLVAELTAQLILLEFVLSDLKVSLLKEGFNR